MIYFMGVVYGNLLQVDLTTFFPYLALGMVIWQFSVSLIIEGLDSFVEGGGMIKQVSLPFSFYVYKVLYRNVLVTAHQIVGLIPIFIYFKVPFNFPGFVLGFIVFVSIVFFAMLLMSMLGARYRDIKPIISSVLNVLFFVTPVIWMPDMLSGRKLMLVKYNPIHHMINLIRDPLLGNNIPPDSWVFCGIFLVILLTLSLIVFGKYKRRIPFWV